MIIMLVVIAIMTTAKTNHGIINQQIDNTYQSADVQDILYYAKFD